MREFYSIAGRNLLSGRGLVLRSGEQGVRLESGRSNQEPECDTKGRQDEMMVIVSQAAEFGRPRNGDALPKKGRLQVLQIVRGGRYSGMRKESFVSRT